MELYKSFDSREEFMVIGCNIADAIIRDTSKIDLYIHLIPDIVTDKDVLNPLLLRLYFNNHLLFCKCCDELIINFNTDVMIEKLLNNITYLKMLDIYIKYNKVHIKNNNYFMKNYYQKRLTYMDSTIKEKFKIKMCYLKDLFDYKS